MLIDCNSEVYDWYKGKGNNHQLACHHVTNTRGFWPEDLPTPSTSQKVEWLGTLLRLCDGSPSIYTVLGSKPSSSRQSLPKKCSASETISLN